MNTPLNAGLLALLFLAGRCLHAYGLGSTPQVVQGRIWGMYLTLAMMVSVALISIFQALF